MPELESTCDLGSKTLFPTRSFTLEHRFAFDSRVPASSCVQYSRTAKLLVIAQVRCSRANEHVEKSLLGRKCYRDSISGIYISFRGPQHVRFLSVRSKLQQIRWKIGSGSANSAKSAHLSNKWMPELESPCDCGSKSLFSKRSFAPEHQFAFDSRVPASSCV